jgi:hypothetical protein
MIGGICWALACASAAPAAGPAEDGMTSEQLLKLADEVQKEVEELRGWKFKRPVKKDVYTEEQLRRYIEKKLFDEQYGGGKLELTQAFLRMVGLIPADCDVRKTIIDVLLNQIGGFYDPDENAFFMLKRGGVDYGPILNRTLIAHELTHALDDQYFELNRFLKDPSLTEDSERAIGAVVEGSATELMMRYMQRAMMSGDFELGDIQRVMADEMERSKVLIQAPPYFSTIVASYLCGMSFMRRGQLAAAVPGAETKDPIAEDLRQAMKNPPTTSEQILHPEKYWERSSRDEPVIVDDGDVEQWLRPTGLRVIHKNTVGELLCSLLTSDASRELSLVGAALPSYWTNDAASGWGGDRFYLLAPGKTDKQAQQAADGRRGVWITLWDTPSDRDEFVSDYADYRRSTTRTVYRWGDRGAVFFFDFEPAVRDKLERTLQSDPPKLTRDGQRWSPTGR